MVHECMEETWTWCSVQAWPHSRPLPPFKPKWRQVSRASTGIGQMGIPISPFAAHLSPNPTPSGVATTTLSLLIFFSLYPPHAFLHSTPLQLLTHPRPLASTWFLSTGHLPFSNRIHTLITSHGTFTAPANFPSHSYLSPLPFPFHLHNLLPMDRNIPELTTTSALSQIATGSARSVHEERARLEEAGKNLESASSASLPISGDQRLQNQEVEGNPIFQFGFPSDCIDSSMFPANPLGIENSGRFDTLGPSTAGAYFGDTGVGTSYPQELFRSSSSRSKLQQQLIRWPSSITKAARSKRRIARKMGSSSSFSSSSSPSLNLTPDTPTPNDPNKVEDEDNRTITTSDNKKLRFLFQKVLKNSDVSSLGRIVLPKKDAEAHLPSLTVKEGIQMTVRDVSSTTFWCMRYRFWPNNNSKMYVLENTGEFVRQNSLQAGDMMMVYEEDENKELFICGKKVERRTPARPGVLVSRPLYYAPLLHQQQPQQQHYHHHFHHHQQQQQEHHYHHQQQQQQQQQQLQQQQQQFYYMPQNQNRVIIRDNIGGSSTVGDCSSSYTAAAASSSFRTTTSTTQPPPPPPAVAAGVEEPSLFNDATVGLRQEEVTGAYSLQFTDFDDSVFGELDMLPNFRSLYDDYLVKDDPDDGGNADKSNTDTAPAK
ncbi:uncharacterized protein LOC122093568 [Macadamia integrifolia]|uniref:uncharacterized protein LOC122093568 n=1 Tax=Macadamia integrifolia TaxID=60698 RepID=UPI001C52E024|nr:uncharacterized protein LOC122093568 [Macadamia integrifolia]